MCHPRQWEASAVDGVPSPSGPEGSGSAAALSARARQLKERLLGEFSLSVDDVAGILEVDRSTVYRYIQDGALAALKIGREYRLSDADVEGFLQALIARERQRVAELRVRALTSAGGPSGPAAVPAAVPGAVPVPPVRAAAPEAAAVVEPAPSEGSEGGATPMGPMAVGLQGVAADQARRTGHREVRPAHVLLALISDGDCLLWDRPFLERIPLRAAMARQALDRAGADIETLRAAVEATLPAPDGEPGQGPADRDMAAVHRAVWGPAARDAMRSVGRRWLGTDAILLALYADADLAAALNGAGADEVRVRAELQRMAGTLATTEAARTRFSELARDTGQRAAERAWERRARAIEPEHLLLALLEEGGAAGDGLAQRALAAVGADLDAIRSWAEARLGPAAAGAPDPDAAPLQPNPGLRTVVFERAPAAARGLGHAEVGTEHLLLGLYSIPEIADRLERAHAPHGEVRGAIRRLAPPGASQRTEGRPMFGRYSERAQRVIVLAQEESRRRGTGFVATAHLMLGLIREGSGIAPKALRALGLDLDALSQRVAALLPEPKFPGGGPAGGIQFTPNAKALLMDHAIAAARALGHQYVGTEHLLLAAYDADPVVARLLEEIGAVREGVEAAILRLMGADPKGPDLPVPQHPAVGSALSLAARRARALGHRLVQPAHLLLGLLDLPGGAARAVLERLHVDLGALEASVAATLPKGRQGDRVTPATDGGVLVGGVGLSPASQDVMARAADQASAAGARRMGSEHLLLGLYAAPTSEVVQLLTAAGAPEDAVAVEAARSGAGDREDAAAEG